jgi:hypothetical protein
MNPLLGICLSFSAEEQLQPPPPLLADMRRLAVGHLFPSVFSQYRVSSLCRTLLPFVG